MHEVVKRCSQNINACCRASHRTKKEEESWEHLSALLVAEQDLWVVVGDEINESVDEQRERRLKIYAVRGEDKICVRGKACWFLRTPLA